MIDSCGAVRRSSAGRRGRSHRRARQLCAVLSGAFLLPMATGCYTYRAAPDGTLPLGETVALGITDRGRVGLGEQVGPGVLRIRGELVGVTDSTYTLRVRSVEQLNGRTTKWGGEQVTVSRDYVGTAAEQRYSRARTVLAIGGLAAGIALAAVAISLNTSGNGGGDDGGGGNNQQ